MPKIENVTSCFHSQFSAILSDCLIGETASQETQTDAYFWWHGRIGGGLGEFDCGVCEYRC